MLPNLIVHADWGSFAHNRILASARLIKDSYYLADELEEVPEPGVLLNKLRNTTDSEGAILAGFDFPIGLPANFAKKAELNDFLALLPCLGLEKWAEFYNIAENSQQISLERPFYPYRPGGTTQAQLVGALGVGSFDDLRRQCEKGGQGRPVATPLFWTLGPSQVGRGAIIGWRDMLVPVLRAGNIDIKIWPFHGSLFDLFAKGRIVVAETYPSDFRFHFGIGVGNNEESRILNANSILRLAELVGLTISNNLRDLIRKGFGNNRNSRDCFDAFVGLIGVLSVIRGKIPEGTPNNETVRRIEGWILGRPRL